MKVDTALRKSLLKYPTIERNKLDVYIQMFITTGGGYDWVNGSLCTPSESTINTKEQAIKYLIDDTIEKLSSNGDSNILRIPDNIKSDWKAAIMEFYDWIIQHQSYFDQENWNEYKDKLEKSVNKIR